MKAPRNLLSQLAWVAGAAFLCTTAAEVRPVDGPGPLPWRVGGRVGFTVDAAAIPDSTGMRMEVYVRIPPATIAGLTHDASGGGKLRLVAQLRSGFRGRQEAARHDFEISPDDTARGFGKLVVLRFAARSGPQSLDIRLDDTQSRKRGLWYVGRQVNIGSSVQGEFQVADARQGMTVSDPRFVWTGSGEDTASSGRVAREWLPNPERLYGLFASDLRVSLLARGGTESAPWHWKARILDAEGRALAERDSIAAPAVWTNAELTFDLSSVPAGGYDLDVAVWRGGMPVPAPQKAHFSVAWQAASWFRNPRDIEDTVHFLLGPNDEEAFGRMHPGEQEKYLDDFWKLRDPTPGTARNESRDRFLERIDIANHTYGRYGLGRGMFSDMGRVFIRYGEPGEVLHQVIPSGDNTLLQVIRQLSLTEDRSAGGVRGKGLGGDMRPFEIWIYEGSVALPPDADPRVRASHRLRMVFLFVDEQGLGDYTLRYSTE